MSMIGITLTHCENTNQPGKGGMGEVYPAKDRKPGRDDRYISPTKRRMPYG